jgi:hypothetical protein
VFAIVLQRCIVDLPHLLEVFIEHRIRDAASEGFLNAINNIAHVGITAKGIGQAFIDDAVP